MSGLGTGNWLTDWLKVDYIVTCRKKSLATRRPLISNGCNKNVYFSGNAIPADRCIGTAQTTNTFPQKWKDIHGNEYYQWIVDQRIELTPDMHLTWIYQDTHNLAESGIYSSEELELLRKQLMPPITWEAIISVKINVIEGTGHIPQGVEFHNLINEDTLIANNRKFTRVSFGVGWNPRESHIGFPRDICSVQSN